MSFSYKIGNIASGNYTGFEADGSMEFHGDSGVWDDLRVPVTALKVGPLQIPDWDVFKGTLFLYWFDPNGVEQVYFAAQIPHIYTLNTSLHPHVHWVPEANGVAGQVVSWGLEYSWADIGQVFPDTNTIYGNTHHPSDSVLLANKHYLTPLTTIDAGAVAGQDVSSMLICRLFRDATGAGLTDSYTDDAGVLEFDFHIEINTVGSREQFVK